MIKATKIAMAIFPNYLVFNHLFNKEFVNCILIIFIIWGESLPANSFLNVSKLLQCLTSATQRKS